MQSFDVMQRLAATSSRKDKEQIILEAFLNGSSEFFIGAKLALDPLISFGIAKVAEIIEDDGDAGSFTFAEFVALASKLRNRELTGHAARDAIHEAASRCHVPTWNLFYRRVLLKKLGVGVTDKTINKVLAKLVPGYPEAKDYLIPRFACQLAENGEGEAHRKKVAGRKLIDCKLDGVRTLAVLDKEADAVTLFSREGSIFENFVDLVDALKNLLPRLPGSVVLDGEMVHAKGFQYLMTLVQSGSHLAEMKEVRLALFDVIPLTDFRQGFCAKPQHERHHVLQVLHESGLPGLTSGRVYVLPKLELDLSTEAGQAAFAEFNCRAIELGYEGIMIKDPDAPYEGKRSSAWLKKKPFIEVTLEVIGFERGNADGKFRNTLGALVGKGEYAGHQIICNVAGGIPDDLRDQIWQNQERYLGMMIEVRADKLTIAQGATTYSLRFPEFKGFRGRTPGEIV